MPFPRRLILLVLLAAPALAGGQEVTATARAGLYADSDYTDIFRTLFVVDAALGRWRLGVHEAVDIVSSASIDVRTAGGARAAKPRLAVDAISAATRPGSGGGTPVGSGSVDVVPTVYMADRRYETTASGGYDDGAGHLAGGSLTYATENDYQSVGVGARAAWDLEGRNTTLLASANVHHDTVASVLDPAFGATSDTVGGSVGVARVLGPDDALRVRYDGSFVTGYQGSPYRSVRFGPWTTVLNVDGTLTFKNTMGSAGGLPEKLPGTRMRHALVGEWLHALGDQVGLAAQLRVARDSWGLLAGGLAVDLRVGGDEWSLRLGYRFFAQGAASFFRDQYLAAPETYAYYSADKELGGEVGHLGTLDLAHVTSDWPTRGARATLDGKLTLMHYAYPGFTLLPSRNGAFVELGLNLGF